MEQSLSVSRNALERARRITLRVWIAAGALLVLVLFLSVPSLRNFMESARGMISIRNLAAFSNSNNLDPVDNG